MADDLAPIRVESQRAEQFIDLAGSEDERTEDPAAEIASSGKRKKNPKKLQSLAKAALPKYVRGEGNSAKDIKYPKLKQAVERQERQAKQAALAAARAEILNTEQAGSLEAEGMERTFKFTQEDIAKHVDLSSQRKMFELSLDTFGPYHASYTRNGRIVLLAGRKGHLSAFDWKAGRLLCEFHVRETIRDATFLHNETLFAVAQKRIVYVYDNTGAEIHALEKHVDVNKLDFLPYHFLLASVGNQGILRYQDMSTGKFLGDFRTKLGPCDVMRQNPHNAVMHLGHKGGTVTLWTPNMTVPAIKALTHRGPVQGAVAHSVYFALTNYFSALAVDHSGTYMATAGLDGFVRVSRR